MVTSSELQGQEHAGAVGSFFLSQFCQLLVVAGGTEVTGEKETVCATRRKLRNTESIIVHNMPWLEFGTLWQVGFVRSKGERGGRKCEMCTPLS